MTSRLKIERMRRDLRQFDLAKELGVSVSYFSKIEAGHELPTFAQAEKIADILETAVEHLWEIENQKGVRALVEYAAADFVEMKR